MPSWKGVTGLKVILPNSGPPTRTSLAGHARDPPSYCVQAKPKSPRPVPSGCLQTFHRIPVRVCPNINVYIHMSHRLI
ncbi:MAG TPA: hypothetical protein VMU35_09450 [Methylomirabilota bacterium]|nr:hypothetical protein [Methylomirabilota bacterium]